MQDEWLLNLGLLWSRTCKRLCGRVVLNPFAGEYCDILGHVHMLLAVLVQSAFKKHMCFFVLFCAFLCFFVLFFDQPLFYVLFCAFFWP